MKNILYLPSAASFIIAIFNFFLNNQLNAALWFFVSILFLIMFVPITINLPEKKIPTMQVFIILFLFFIFFFIISSVDIAKTNLAPGKSILLGFLTSLTIITLAMLLKGKD